MEVPPRNAASGMESAAALTTYYRDAHVRQRIREFLGVGRGGEASCRFLTADDAAASRRVPQPVETLDAALDAGLEIGRSLWDRKVLVADLDLEYVNFDFPAEVYRHPERAFECQAPVVSAVEDLLADCGIKALHTLSGRGHHFTWCVPLEGGACRRLEELGLDLALASERGPEPSPLGGARVAPTVRDAFLGLGLVMEFLAGEVRHRTAATSAVPVELTAVEAGPSEFGREIVSIDISEYGDPLSSRATRVPFSVYFKPRQLHRDAAPGIESSAWPPLFAIPRGDGPLADDLRAMRDPDLARGRAARGSTAIPSCERGMLELIRAYEGSGLRPFHRWFYSHRQHPRSEWPATYDQLPLEQLPTCARQVLARPNDALLKPSGMRLITRVLLALGWHPRHIAGLIRATFERDHGWGRQWEGYDPAMRADLYTRIFTGPFVMRTDDLIDFNCQSSKEQQTCPAVVCSWNLERFRDSALARRRYESLGHRPLNGLFLPREHL